LARRDSNFPRHVPGLCSRVPDLGLHLWASVALALAFTYGHWLPAFTLGTRSSSPARNDLFMARRSLHASTCRLVKQLNPLCNAFGRLPRLSAYSDSPSGIGSLHLRVSNFSASGRVASFTRNRFGCRTSLPPGALPPSPETASGVGLLCLRASYRPRLRVPPPRCHWAVASASTLECCAREDMLPLLRPVPR